LLHIKNRTSLLFPVSSGL